MNADRPPEHRVRRRVRFVLHGLLALTALLLIVQARGLGAPGDGVSWTTAGLLALLGLLALTVAEPTARAVGEQEDRLRAQALALERLALVAEHTQNPVLLLDADFRVTWVNPAFERVTGWTAAETVGRMPGRHRRGSVADEAALDRLEADVRAGRGAREQLCLRTKDGRDYWADVELQPVRDATGAVHGYISVETDVTALVQQRHETNALLAALPTGLMVRDREGRVVRFNAAAAQLLGVSEAALMHSKPDAIDWRLAGDDQRPMRPDDHPALRALSTGVPQRATVGMVTPGGDLRWLHTLVQPLRGLSGQVEGVVASFSDVTAQRLRERLLDLTLEGSGMGVWQWDVRADRVQGNRSLHHMLGWPPVAEPLPAAAWEQLIHPDDLPTWHGALAQLTREPGTPHRCELRLRRRHGGWTPVMASGAVIERAADGSALRVAGILADVTEEMRLRETLQRSARTDELTGLANRRVVLDRIDHALARWRADGTRFAVLFMDCDRFKQVNDTHGHAAGDALLRQVSARLTRVLRSGDAVVRTAARIGGDEFVVVLEAIQDDDDAVAVAQRLLVALSEPYELGAMRLHTAVSIGIVTAANAGDDAQTVLRDADTAMYEAKRAGRGRHALFDPSMHERVAMRMRLENDLREGLERGELFAVYQPVVPLGGAEGADDEGWGVEALARWKHPVRGLVPPVEFVPVAEDCGLIGDVGEFVLDAACEQFVRWQRELGPCAPRRISVNVSRAQIKSEGFVARVSRIVARHGIDAGRLQLEVTESLAAQDDAVQATLRELKALGLRLALDDFGTGYSSLACLHLLPVDTVKIDRSFTVHAEASEYHRVLIEATIRVARTLGMQTVAEGIETAGQAALMTRLACDRGQGYLFSRPLVAEDLGAWATGRETRAAA